MRDSYRIIRYLIAIIWLANGLFCKVLNLVPRHEFIVARILGAAHSRWLTILIGLSEILMAVWIVSGVKSRLNAICQISIIAIMNLIEYFLASDLLLWGKINALLALFLMGLIYYNEFAFNIKINRTN